MAFSFPASPAVNDTYTVNNRTYTWTGSVWEMTGGKIVTAQIQDLGVTTAKIADSAITTDKIAAGAVVEADIASNAVTQAKLHTTLSGITICTSSTRPGSPFEGQMIYETNTDILAIWNGSSWRQLAATNKTGSVLQVVSFTTGTSVNYTTTNVTSGITATITPSSTASKILITGCTGNISHAAARDWTEMRLYKNGSSLVILDGYIGDQSTTATAMSMGGVPFNYLDSPATTSATTYAIFLKTVLGQTWTVAGGSITLQEIAG